MAINGKQINANHIVLLFFAIIIGAVLYYILLWEPLGGWVFEQIVMPIMGILLPDNPNILEGIACMILSMIFIYVFFFIPYILVLCLVIAAFILKK